MQFKAHFLNLLIERVFLWGALLLVCFATYTHFAAAPYLGFNFIFSGRIALATSVEDATGEQLMPGDLLLAVNGVDFAQLIADRRQPIPILSTAQAGDLLRLSVLRADSEQIEIFWIVPGVTQRELLFRFGEFWWIGFVFWVAALATVLLVRPKDLNWRLLVTFFLITAIWLSMGNSPVIYEGTYSLFASSVWLTIPIYLHLHWNFPKPLHPVPNWGFRLLYLICVPIILLEALALIPAHSYYIGGLISIGGTCVLVVARFVLRTEDRSNVRIMLGGISVSFLPLLIPIVARLFNVDNFTLMLTTFGLPILPLTYFYMAYRYQLGEMELRANRVIALYLYFLAVLMVVPILFIAINLSGADATFRSLGITLVTTVMVMLSVVGFPYFQRMIETHLLGMPLSPERLLHTYSLRISATSVTGGLVKLLREDVLPSLLIRQSVLYRWHNRSLSLVDKVNLDENQLPTLEDVPILVSQADRYLPVYGSHLAANSPHLAWVRLILPLRFDGDIIGLWLLGQRDPDDFYAYKEVEMLSILAQQTAVALSSIIQMEQLRLIYQANVERHELERKKLALMLHDEVLNRQAQILWDLPAEAITPEIDGIYHSLTDHVRQIILELRPPLLAYGLHMALEELIDGYLERNPIANVEMDVIDADQRYPLKVEEHVFRVVQQALENALTHAGEASIRLSGHFDAGHIMLQICDTGQGFNIDQMDFRRLLMDRRFGLIGMQERATLIGADLQIESTSGSGTRITLTWHAENHADDLP